MFAGAQPAFTRDGLLLLGAPGDRLEVWDPATGQPDAGRVIPAANAQCVAVSHDGQTLALNAGKPAGEHASLTGKASGGGKQQHYACRNNHA